ncbi:hypothetical protein B0H19DRAFT_1071091 [Mycena capillaripes]|nr:hypothetical protein B0H19DRAFT_1071091 [Mycena capillaripes]
MVSARTTAPSPCVQKCASASNDPELTNCNPSYVFSVPRRRLPVQQRELPESGRGSLLDPRQDAGASTVPEDPATATSAFSDPSPTPVPIVTPSFTSSLPSVPPSPSAHPAQPTTSSTDSPAPSHKVNTAAIAGGVVGGLLTIALIAITMWCMRGRFRFRIERIEEKQKERAVVDPVQPPAPAAVNADADRVNELRSPSALALDRPVPPSVLATQAAMWEKASSAASLPSSSPRVPEKNPDIDVAALLWNDPHGGPHGGSRSQSSGTRHTPTMSVASGSGGGSSVPTSSSAAGSGGSRSVRPDPSTEMQLRVMAERVAQLEAAISARGASSPPVDELPPNYTPGPLDLGHGDIERSALTEVNCARAHRDSKTSSSAYEVFFGGPTSRDFVVTRLLRAIFGPADFARVLDLPTLRGISNSDFAQSIAEVVQFPQYRHSASLCPGSELQLACLEGRTKLSSHTIKLLQSPRNAGGAVDFPRVQLSTSPPALLNENVELPGQMGEKHPDWQSFLSSDMQSSRFVKSK